MRRILVIKLGALGDVVLAFGPFAAIRAAHLDADITLLTTAPFAEFARAAPWFDRVVVDARPRPWELPALWRLRQMLRGFDMVYDLQTSDRSGWYFRLAGRPAWSGIARGCKFPHANPVRDTMHTVERQREQLAMAGITACPAPPLSFLKKPSPSSGRGLGEGSSGTRPGACPKLPHPGPLLEQGEGGIVLVPGAAPHRPRKRWPAERFGQLAAMLPGPVVIVGTAADAAHAATIRAHCPAAIDLTGRTSLLQLAQTLASASLAIGNDTGPTHLAAALGVPTIALFSADSDPALTRPRGPAGEEVTVIAEPDLADLTLARVAAALLPVHSHHPAALEAL